MQDFILLPFPIIIIFSLFYVQPSPLWISTLLEQYIIVTWFGFVRNIKIRFLRTLDNCGFIINNWIGYYSMELQSCFKIAVLNIDYYWWYLNNDLRP